MTQNRTTTSMPQGPSATKIVLAIAIGTALAVGAGAAVYGVWRASHDQPANVTVPQFEQLGAPGAAKVVGRSAGAFRPGFDRARAIAVSPAREVYVSGDFAIRRFDADGRKLSEISTIEPPGAIAVAADGKIYATFGDKVWVFSKAGERIATWPERTGALLTSIAVCNAGVFVADAGKRCVVHYAADGNQIAIIGKKDQTRNSPGFFVPSPYFDLAMAPDGLLRVTNPGRHQIVTFTTDGDRGDGWGHFSTSDPNGFVGCCNPANFTIVPLGGKHGEFAGFVTAEKGLARVKVFNPDGKFVGLLAPADAFARHDELVATLPTGQPFCALDVAAGPNGRIYVLDGLVGHVRMYEWERPGEK